MKLKRNLRVAAFAVALATLAALSLLGIEQADSASRPSDSTIAKCMGHNQGRAHDKVVRNLVRDEVFNTKREAEAFMLTLYILEIPEMRRNSSNQILNQWLRESGCSR